MTAHTLYLLYIYCWFLLCIGYTLLQTLQTKNALPDSNQALQPSNAPLGEQCKLQLLAQQQLHYKYLWAPVTFCNIHNHSQANHAIYTTIHQLITV